MICFHFLGRVNAFLAYQALLFLFYFLFSFFIFYFLEGGTQGEIFNVAVTRNLDLDSSWL